MILIGPVASENNLFKCMGNLSWRNISQLILLAFHFSLGRISQVKYICTNWLDKYALFKLKPFKCTSTNMQSTVSEKRIWLVGCCGFNGPLRQYFSLYRAVSQRGGERGEKGQSKNVQTTPTRTYCKHNRPLPDCHLNCRTPKHWKFTQYHRTTRPTPTKKKEVPFSYTWEIWENWNISQPVYRLCNCF